MKGQTDRLTTIDITKIRESRRNPRKDFDTRALAELAESVKAQGVLTPILVRPTKEGYELVAGARRLRAAKRAGLEEIPAYVREMDDRTAEEARLVENVQRADLAPMEEAEAIRTLITRHRGMTFAEAAEALGKPEAYVRRRAKLLDLVEPAKKALREGRITAAHAEILARLGPNEQKEALAALRDGIDGSYRSVTELRRWAERNVYLDLRRAPWKTADATVLPSAGACAACSKRTGSSPMLFSDIRCADTCTDPGCFQAKLAAFIERAKVEAKEKGEALVDLTEAYYSREEDGPLTRDRWVPVDEGSCEKVRSGILVEGRNAGRIVRFCADPKCPVHRPGSVVDLEERRKARARTKKERQKQKAEEAKRRALFDSIIEKVSHPLPLLALRIVTRTAFAGAWHGNQKAVAEALGIPVKKNRHGFTDLASSAEAAIRRMDSDDLARVLVALAAAADLAGPGRPCFLADLARAVGVDPKAGPTRPIPTRAPRVRGPQAPGRGRGVGPAPESTKGGSTMRGETLCHPRCRGSRGKRCECRCGGRNHGALSRLEAPKGRIVVLSRSLRPGLPAEEEVAA